MRTRVEHNTLDDIDDERDTVAEAKGGGDLVAEVDVAGRVDEVDEEGLVARVGQHQGQGRRLDADAALLLVEARVRELGLRKE